MLTHLHLLLKPLKLKSSHYFPMSMVLPVISLYVTGLAASGSLIGSHLHQLRPHLSAHQLDTLLTAMTVESTLSARMLVMASSLNTPCPAQLDFTSTLIPNTVTILEMCHHAQIETE